MLRKRQAAAERLGENPQEDGALDYVEWRAVEEGFRLLERDLGKMQACPFTCICRSLLTHE